MNSPLPHEIGDWICWQRADGLVIAEIHYIRKPDSYPYRTELVTSKGVCRPDNVLETRRKNP